MSFGGGFLEVMGNLSRVFNGLSQFDATLGRNNTEDDEYLRRQRKVAGKYKISYAKKSQTPAGTFMHSSSFQLFGNRNEIVQVRER